MKKISIILPAYNEEGNIKQIYRTLSELFGTLGYECEMIFCDDGSSDRTLEVIRKISETDDRVFFIEFSRNFGHQSALKAGTDLCSGDCVITMDCDMQHPPELIPEMISKWEEGYDIVYTRRKDDQKIPFFKRTTSRLFYWITNKLSGVQIEEGCADFRLMDRKAVNVFTKLNENDLFIRGLVKWLGFKQYAIDYTPGKRFSGTTKYSVKKMTNLAIRGITSFSTAPLYAAIYLGFIFSLGSLLYFPYVIYSIIAHHAQLGWSSLILTVVFFGGIQMILMGILGIYIGKIFMQSKERPNYIIRSTNIREYHP